MELMSKYCIHLLKEPRAIHMLIYDPKKSHNSIVLRIYAPAQYKEKYKFWEHLL